MCSSYLKVFKGVELTGEVAAFTGLVLWRPGSVVAWFGPAVALWWPGLALWWPGLALWWPGLALRCSSEAPVTVGGPVECRPIPAHFRPIRVSLPPDRPFSQMV